MANLQIELEKQLLTIKNQELIASGDSNFDSCTFIFDELWEGFTKTAVFYQNKSNVQYTVLESDDTCMIPTAAMARAGRMYIGVFGIKDTAVVTSTLATIDIMEGAISGDTVSTEPTDDVFLAIIAQYQRIASLMSSYNTMAEELRQECSALMQTVDDSINEQNKILQTLGAFDVIELEYRMSAMEMTLSGYGAQIQSEVETMDNLLTEIRNSAFLIRDVEVEFNDDLECIIEDERVTEDSIVNAYFDAISVESALNVAIYVESFDGYIRFSTTTKFKETLNCTIEVRRY